jgi:hypothetical protein
VLATAAVAIAVTVVAVLGLHLGVDKLVRLDLGADQLALVGKRFFRNECGSDPDKLTHWNRGETFISLGILHMLWYPGEQAVRYRETFPDFVRFCKLQQQRVPPWIMDALATGCPWPDRTTFYAQFDSELVRSLRRFLERTTGLQAAFAHRRLAGSLRPIIRQAPITESLPLAIKLFWMSRTTNGLFALIDYVNFKGEGLDPKERYQEVGWGLYQVLAGMPLTFSAQPALQAFVASAKAVLSRRVANAPDPDKERDWLPGWHKRLDTYLVPVQNW